MTRRASTAAAVFERSFASRQRYADPFNDVDVDAIFSRGEEVWRVPCFWNGEDRWAVRFGPPEPGEYGYELESTDRSNADLNGRKCTITIGPYTGASTLLQHGMLRVSRSKRYLEYADGTPFYWLGDTWWTGLSDRLPWDGFRELTADRKAKGFTLVQLVAGLVPFEELAPVDPGFHNEGGAVWDAHFTRINPRYFDYADRRVLHLVQEGLVPAIVGAWREVLEKMGVAKMKKHWRYLVARYGAYPVVWVVGGELIDPPQEEAHRVRSDHVVLPGGWTEVARYLREIDPYGHPLTVHEYPPPYDFPLRDESLSDIDLLQPGHFGWPSIAASVAQVNLHRARTRVNKPVVVGEIGYEKLSESHLEDFQRAAFWLSMLNGAAGHTYGAAATWESYTATKPFHRRKWTYLTWDEGMNLPGSYQVGLGAKLLQRYSWWRFEPHPEWVTPRGTTFLEPRDGIHEFQFAPWNLSDDAGRPDEQSWPGGDWAACNGTFRLPYAAGIPNEVRIVYIPYFGLSNVRKAPPTVLGLEVGVRYRAFYWEPALGITIDLGFVERSVPGRILLENGFEARAQAVSLGRPVCGGGRERSALVAQVDEPDVIASVETSSAAEVGVILRFHTAEDHLVGVYSVSDREIYVVDRQGKSTSVLGRTAVPPMSTDVRLTAEVRGKTAVVSVTDGAQTVTTPIVDVGNVKAGAAGVATLNGSTPGAGNNFVLRRSPRLVPDGHLERALYDARGQYRGELSGPGWDAWGREKNLLLDAYRPPDVPHPQDWILVLDSHG